MKWLAGLVLLGLPFYVADAACGGSDEMDDSPTTNPTEDPTGLDTCSDLEEALGPFIEGIHPEYDPAQDWDGDGIACES